ncbi:mariner Mos1 transposase [Trichonephila clavipes]|nr:mariner Mos1 transposase [Trichonephila clavipes]
MSNFMPSDAAESHQMLVEAYESNALSRAQCYRWFEKFQNGDFDSTVSRRLKAMGKIIKVGRWVPRKLTDRQQEKQKIVCEMLLAHYKRKSYLHRIVTGDEKWIYFENSKRNRTYVDPGQLSKSTARPNRFGRKTML